MQITVSQEQGRVPITVFELDGLLNIGTTGLLDKEGRAAYSSGARYLLLDLSRLTSLTSAGLRSILLLSRLFAQGTSAAGSGEKPEINEMHTRVKLLNPNPQIENVLTIAGFTSFLEVFHDRQAAIDSFP